MKAYKIFIEGQSSEEDNGRDYYSKLDDVEANNLNNKLEAWLNSGPLSNCRSSLTTYFKAQFWKRERYDNNSIDNPLVTWSILVHTQRKYKLRK